ncbi:Hsp20/alpha crystallin family protein [Syntrophus aciditrophicus]|uniref:Molecular chaperone n=1 Tax=Syntrophus aciditrophicus (strain SB) TaxID=56780 RepID=Q2LPJ6_SYNAS|nr:Hsp20/alpha crystallin family protein [Syntrophus aciditrophicus]ABC75930.1 molecular chaperone [Syntrophus aciditrophicus SB]OPY17129.1 MAG: Spore protein SP21 [Syntrophus sp. PtaB.Bin075]
MAMKSLLPSLWKKGETPSKREEEHPFYSLQREMNRLFDDFFRGFDLEPFATMEDRYAGFTPSIDVRENDDALTIKAEIPGIDEKDVEVLVSDDSVTIKGEKKEEQEDKGKDYYRLERTYGSFHRVIPLPKGINLEKVEATFKNGLLSIKLPKTEEAQTKSKKIPISTE